MAIDVRASFDAEVSDVQLFEVIRNLATYPQWLDIVHFAEPSDSEHGFQSWNVELRAKIGPFARSKRRQEACTMGVDFRSDCNGHEVNADGSPPLRRVVI